MSLPEPDFIARDPAVIEQEIFEHWESLGGDALSPTDPESLLLKVLAYRETLVRVGIQDTAKHLLLRFAIYPVIDFLGELVGAYRLTARPARTTLQFTLPTVHGTPITIVSGTRRKSRDGRVTFATIADVTIPAGSLSAQVLADCLTAGAVGNGYIAGQIDVEVDPLPNSITAANVTVSGAGAPIEEDEAFLERILLAPDAFSTAGPPQAYEYWARTASAAVADVSVLSPEPGEIQLVVLDQSGVPGSELLDLVEETFTDQPIRPMSDEVTAVACTEVTWMIDVGLILFSDADQGETLAAAELGAEAYRDSRQAKLGRDLVPNQLGALVKVDGVYDYVINSPMLTEVSEQQWANCTGVVVSVDGTVAESMA